MFLPRCSLIISYHLCYLGSSQGTNCTGNSIGATPTCNCLMTLFLHTVCSMKHDTLYNMLAYFFSNKAASSGKKSCKIPLHFLYQLPYWQEYAHHPNDNHNT